MGTGVGLVRMRSIFFCHEASKTKMLKVCWLALLSRGRRSWRVDRKERDVHRLLVSFWTSLGYSVLVSDIIIAKAS